MNSYKIIGIILILISVTGYALYFYQYSINKSKFPIILFSTMLFGYGVRLLAHKKWISMLLKEVNHIFGDIGRLWTDSFSLLNASSDDKKHCHQHSIVAIGADGSNWTLGTLLYFCCRLTETDQSFVSNWTSVIYIGESSGKTFSNSPTSTILFRYRQAKNDILRTIWSNLGRLFRVYFLCPWTVFGTDRKSVV